MQLAPFADLVFNDDMPEFEKLYLESLVEEITAYKFQHHQYQLRCREQSQRWLEFGDNFEARIFPILDSLALAITATEDRIRQFINLKV